MSKKIMLIEDDKDLRRNMCQLLESEGYFVQVAENGQVALDLLKDGQDLPAMIILDLMMPVMDGFQFREHQLLIPHLSSIPVAIMTADGHTDEKKRRTNAHAALRKPADIDLILKTVEELSKG